MILSGESLVTDVQLPWVASDYPSEWPGWLVVAHSNVGCETYQLVLRENPQPCLDPPIVRMARWPKTPGELERYIGAESVRTIRRKESFVCGVYSMCIYRVRR